MDISSHELLQTNAEMWAVFHAFPDLFFWLDSEGKILDCKGGHSSDLYLPPEKMIGRMIQESPHENISDWIQESIQSMRDTGSIASTEYSLIAEDRKYYFEARLLPLLEKQMIMIVRNITERKAAEKMINESEEKYHGIVETSPDMIFILERKTAKILDVNKSVCKLLGYSKDEIIGTVSGDRVVSEQRNSFKDQLEKLKSTGKFFGEFDIQKKDGTTLTVEARGAAFGDYAFAIGRDITERKRNEKELKVREEELRATIESTDDGILVVDDQGDVIHSNQRFAGMWHIPEKLIKTGNDEQLLNHVLEQLIDPEAFLSKVRALYESSEPGMDTLFFKDGRVFERLSNPLIIDGRVAGRVWSFRDITERKRLEESLLKIEERERQHIGHDLHDDLGQMLVGILLKSKSMELKLKKNHTIKDKDLSEITSLLSRATQHVKEISLGLSPIVEEGEDSLMVAMEQIASNSKTLFDVQCAVKYDGPVPINNERAVLQLYRIAQEAVTNAVKHADPGHIEIYLRKEDNVITISIQDLITE
jgi:PAS domain S-box-containing protein